MAQLELLLQWAQTYSWFPTLAFVGILAGLYWMIRPVALAPDPASPAEAPPVFAPSKPKDQRVGSRRQGNPVEVYVASPEEKQKPEIGSVLDRSVGGMRLLLFHEVDAGKILAIRPVRADNMVPWVDIEVRSCKPSLDMPEQFEVGCQYVKSPPYSIQLLFG